MTELKLSEHELLLLEKMRILRQQDPTFRHLPKVLADRFDIMVEKGKRVNGKKVGVMDLIFCLGDISAWVFSFEPLNRLRKTIRDSDGDVPDDKCLNEIQDSPNYIDMWACCREERKQGVA